MGLSGLTFSGEMRGTVPFMPPEQMLDFKTVTPLADLYATAATLYYMLTCKYIYDEPAGGGDLIRMLLEEQPVPLRKRRPDVPAGPGHGHREMPGPRSQGTHHRRRLDAPGAQAVLLIACSRVSSRSQQRQTCVPLPQDRRRVDVQPLADERRVEVAEIDGETGIAGLVEIGQVGVVPKRPPLTASGDQHRGRRPVVGAAVGVLLEPAAELRKDQDHDSLVELARELSLSRNPAKAFPIVCKSCWWA